jgi:tetratricopeptide (TPR) repeat protein
LDGPAALGAAGDRLWIADAGNARIVAWGVDGSSPTQTPVGSRGSREGQFKSPAAVAVDARGRLLVADSATKRVQLFSPDGLYLRSLPGPFLAPVGVASLPAGPAVLDAGAKTVLFFDDTGRPSGAPSPIFVNPVALAADPRGRLGFAYVLDAGDGQVKVLNGPRLVARFGDPSLFRDPKAIALDDRGAVWVADADGVKAFEVRLSPLAPGSFAAKPGEGRIELSWKGDPENMAEGFRLYRSTLPSTGDAGLWREVRSSSTALSLDRYTSFDDEIVPGLTYYYTISAVAGGLSPLEGARADAKCWTARPVNLPPVDAVSFDMDKIFSAQYKFYEKNAVGRAVIKNNTEKSFQKVRVGFTMQNYMDFVTEKVLDRLEPGARETIDLKATFNNKILSVTEDTPIQAQLTITYYDNGEEKVFKRAEPMTLYARNAMSWDDPRRLATFITPKDPAALEFARASVRDFRKEIEAAPVNPALAKAAIVFEALGAHGLSYLKDPNGPFGGSSDHPKAVDYVQYPRETLKRKTGDCDDLTALMAALMESVGVTTAFLDVPGHVLMAAQLDDSFPLDPGLPDGSVLSRDGARWIPVETTVVGQSFLDAWDQGVKTLRNVSEDRLTLIETQDAWELYPPATLPEEPGVEAPQRTTVTDKFPDGGVKALVSRRLNTLTAKHEAALKANPDDRDARLQLGLVRAESGLLEQSAKDFDVLLAGDPLNAAALNNRANLYWLAGNAAKARELYDRAAKADPKDAGVRINLARAAVKTGDAAAAKEALKEALALDPSLKKDYSSTEDFEK